jgi:hypothetical protein
VNNAGIQHVAPIQDFPIEKWDAILAINLSSAFHTTRLALPPMLRNKWGRIINIASAHGLVASPFKSAYVAAKHGIVGLTKVIALETAEQGITCNAICPGYVYTPLVEAQIEGQAKAHGIAREQVIRDVLGGIPGFFEPNPFAFLGAHYPLGKDKAGFYSTAPLEKTMTDLVNFSLIERCTPRLTVGAAHVRTSQMCYFDSRETAITARHIMASGALPPAFPAIRIEGELYWDGGILSNTPTEAIFEDYPRRNSLIFAVHMWNPRGPEPQTIWEVLQEAPACADVGPLSSHRRLVATRAYAAVSQGRDFRSHVRGRLGPVQEPYPRSVAEGASIVEGGIRGADGG